MYFCIMLNRRSFGPGEIKWLLFKCILIATPYILDVYYIVIKQVVASLSVNIQGTKHTSIKYFYILL